MTARPLTWPMRPSLTEISRLSRRISSWSLPRSRSTRWIWAARAVSMSSRWIVSRPALRRPVVGFLQQVHHLAPAYRQPLGVA
jgi:hypothetical protein